MGEKNQKWKEGVEVIRQMIFAKKIDPSFQNFKDEHPALELGYDKKTMDNWYDFIKWMGAHLYVEDIDFEEELGFEISPLMSSAHDICTQFYYKNNADLIAEAKNDVMGEVCKECDGDGFLNPDGRAVWNKKELEDCEHCDGEGFFEGDADLAYDGIEEAENNIINSCNISSFIELSKIKL